MSEKIEQNIDSDEITLKELILKVIEFYREILKYWYIVLLCILIAFAYLFYEKVTTLVKYPAALTFMLNDDGESGTNSGVGMILGSLGIGGKKGGETANLEKILQLFKTRAVIDRALLKRIDLNDKNDFLVNHIIDEYGLEYLLDEYQRMSWKKQILDEDPNFRMKHDSIAIYTENEQVMMKIVYDNVVGSVGRGIKALMTSSLDEDSGIMAVSVSTTSELLTIEMLNTVYEQLSLFFIEKAIEKQQKTFDILSEKNDSISRVLLQSEYELADFKDSNRKLVTVKGYLKEQRLERQVKILNVMYAEAIKNLEISDFALKRRKPYVQLIDSPMRPLSPRGKSLKMAIIFSIIFGSIISVVFILGRKIIRDAMAE